jgi:hypothetical protein
MSEADDVQTSERPATCKVVESGELMVCERCAIQWDLSDPTPPACEPMTFARMRKRLCAEIEAAETSLKVVAALKRAGTPADPRAAHRRRGELEAVLRLYDKVTESKEIRELINGKKQ